MWLSWESACVECTKALGSVSGKEEKARKAMATFDATALIFSSRQSLLSLFIGIPGFPCFPNSSLCD